MNIKPSKKFEGLVFGDLTVVKDSLERYRPSGRYSEIIWECICSCGNHINKRTNELTYGLIHKSCGCKNYFSNKTIKHKEWNQAGSHVFKQYKANAKNRDFVFELTREEFFSLTKSNCYYCNSIPKTNLTIEGSSYSYNGIDRINNSLGYIRDNVVTCCWTCNKMKGTMDHTDFINQITSILLHLGSPHAK